ncbi:WD40-repeat-containing domain protein [Ganoderma leucocontextum]|nr:WD40-repeat-containing domain protein [Ganoderma leucocontextum]
MSWEPQTSIAVPSPVSALSLGPGGSLIVGSADGSVRWYMLPSTKVVKAIKSVGEEIASIAWLFPKTEPAAIWVASGRRALSFASDSPKMINTAQDAIAVLDIGEDDDDVLNELSISENGKYLAFSSDSGAVGIVDLASKVITRMKNRHTTICGSVKFIPDRPNEIVSGGYDSAVLHFDIGQGSILSRYDITAPAPSEGATVSLSPPFVHSLSVSSSGLIVVSTADGRVWLGGGGEKRLDGKKKRSRKWEGLREDDRIWLQVADGPIVSAAFTNADRFLTCSLLGALAEYSVSRDSDGKLVAAKGWSTSTGGLEKVNAMAAGHCRIVVGGFAKDGKGVAEVWHTVEQEL